MNQNRDPQGVPTGGQYAATEKSDADVALSETEAVPFTVVETEDGIPVTCCPHCGAQESIVEVDQAVRWNTLRMQSNNVAVASLGDGDYDHAGYKCDSCGSEEIGEPEDFEIADWC